MTFQIIDRVDLTSSASSLTFSGIPQTYQSLQVGLSWNNPGGAAPTVKVTFNGDSGANYWYLAIRQNQNTDAQSSQTAIRVGITDSQAGAGRLTLDMIDYSESSTYKTLISSCQSMTQLGTQAINFCGGGTWANTNPITSITILFDGGSMAAGTVAVLYGFVGG